MKDYIDNLTPSQVVEAFIEEYYLVEAIEAGDVIGSFFYDISDTQSQIIDWFHNNVLLLPEGFYVNTIEFTERRVMELTPLEIDGHTKYLDPITEIAYYKPLHNLEIFLNSCSKETQDFFSKKALYSKIDGEGNSFEFLFEDMYTDYLEASEEVQTAFAQDLISYMNKTQLSMPLPCHIEQQEALQKGIMDG